MLAISAMLLALNQLQRMPASSVVFALSALVCLAATGGFIVQERRCLRPIIDLRLFRDLDFSLLNAGHAALNLAGFSVLLLVPFYLSRFGGLSAHATGLLLAASPAGTALAAPLAARLASRMPPRLLAVIGAGAMATGQVMIGAAEPEPNIPVLAGAMLLQGFGVGLFQVAYFDIVTNGDPARRSRRGREPGDDDADDRHGDRRNAADADLPDPAAPFPDRRRRRGRRVSRWFCRNVSLCRPVAGSGGPDGRHARLGTFVAAGPLKDRLRDRRLALS